MSENEVPPVQVPEAPTGYSELRRGPSGRVILEPQGGEQAAQAANDAAQAQVGPRPRQALPKAPGVSPANLRPKGVPGTSMAPRQAPLSDQLSGVLGRFVLKAFQGEDPAFPEGVMQITLSGEGARVCIAAPSVIEEGGRAVQVVGPDDVLFDSGTITMQALGKIMIKGIDVAEEEYQLRQDGLEDDGDDPEWAR